MSDSSYPVTIAVKRSDGSIEHVRVGTAIRSGDGFQLSLGELAIGGTADSPAASSRPARASSASPSSGGGGGMMFPNYGRSKGEPIAGASRQDLEFYANGCRRTLDDPSKSRWHEKERALLAAIETELRNGGEGEGASSFDDGRPPPDEDIPF